MRPIDTSYCFYGDVDLRVDVDNESRLLRQWHSQLWSKELPDGRRLEWSEELGTMGLTHESELGSFRVSSDTIATTHSKYRTNLFDSLRPVERLGYEHGFYTIGGFIVFPRHQQSINQRRGWDHLIKDRFDLTLECIRQHYLGIQANPLVDVLEFNNRYFALFGQGKAGFDAFVAFFHLQDLVHHDAIRWLDGHEARSWDFDVDPLPDTVEEFRRYLDNVLEFVGRRNVRIRAWVESATRS